MSVFKLSILFFLGLNLSGCMFGGQGVQHTGYIIITFSGLSADDLDESLTLEQATHINEYIKESVKFTHAYTTSAIDSAALASVLTGLYPWEHGIRNNGASLYNSNISILPEALRKKGYSSFFISGGAPFLRKSAVSFGFDEFDDRFKTSQYYLSAPEVVDKAISALEARPSARSYIGFLYLADMIYFDGQNKEKKINQIDAALNKLRKYLKDQKQWDNTNIILVGLRGADKIPFLYDSVTRIPLYIKPATKPRDLMPSWKIDDPVTLADLGKTLFSITRIKQMNESPYQIADFSQALNAKNLNIKSRILYSESLAFNLIKSGPASFSLRQEGWVYFPTEKKLFNTYTDRFQTNNLYGKERDVLQSLEKNYLDLKNKLAFKDVKNLDESNLLNYKLNVAKTLFDPIISADEKWRVVSDGVNYSKTDKQIKSWFIDYILDKGDASHGPLIKKLKPPLYNCYQQAEWIRMEAYKKIEKKMLFQCSDPETLAWIQSFTNYKEGKMREAGILYDVARGLTQRRKDLEFLSKNNWLNGLTWDFPSDWPSGTSAFTQFLKETEKTEFSEYFKKKPNF